jgi:hypothetical protein
MSKVVGTSFQDCEVENISFNGATIKAGNLTPATMFGMTRFKKISVVGASYSKAVEALFKRKGIID